ncbi:hypothetical protein E2C01_047475 [Portunus trituberculatus]|uniref:Uncharacterized protein n=1 Tax=Portunus trituberculatus TaxID=210409 RepID=A0A5B7G7K4_PORTR|nr:hypothetical protein [Portunus trituberculatus]
MGKEAAPSRVLCCRLSSVFRFGHEVFLKINNAESKRSSLSPLGWRLMVQTWSREASNEAMLAGSAIHMPAISHPSPQIGVCL